LLRRGKCGCLCGHGEKADGSGVDAELHGGGDAEVRVIWTVRHSEQVRLKLLRVGAVEQGPSSK
jgi:hypothetical protein